MQDDHFKDAADIIRRELLPEEGVTPDDETVLLAMIERRVAELFEHQPEYLMSLLYRLDVLEEKIVPVMRGQSAEPIPLALARLIMERQKQRVETRRRVNPLPMDDAEVWAW